jgi:hypothetical protein
LIKYKNTLEKNLINLNAKNDYMNNKFSKNNNNYTLNSRNKSKINYKKKSNKEINRKIKK